MGSSNIEMASSQESDLSENVFRPFLNLRTNEESEYGIFGNCM